MIPTDRVAGLSIATALVRRERDELADVFRRVRAFVDAVGIGSTRTYCRELRVRTEREAKALIVGEVPVDDVEPIEGGEVDEALDARPGAPRLSNCSHSSVATVMPTLRT